MFKGLSKYAIGLWTVLAIMGAAWKVDADVQFLPGSDIMIETQYKTTSSGTIPSTVLWKITAQRFQNVTQLTYYYQGNRKFCTVKFDTTQSNPEFLLTGANGNLIDQSTGGIIPVPGFPAPCRFIIFSNDSSSGYVKLRQKAGGRTFLKTYTLDIEPVSAETAIAKGWVDPGYQPKDDEDPFSMLTVKDENEQFLFKQLWEKESDWWLYEEAMSSTSHKK